MIFDNWHSFGTHKFLTKTQKLTNSRHDFIGQLLFYIEFPLKWYTKCDIISFLNTFDFFLKDVFTWKEYTIFLDNHTFTYCIPFESKFNEE